MLYTKFDILTLICIIYTTYLRQLEYISFIASIVNMLYIYTKRLGYDKKDVESTNRKIYAFKGTTIILSVGGVFVS